MTITFQGTLAFEPGFVKRLPQLEKAMAAHRLAATSFVISKDVATSATKAMIRPLFYDYTVVSGDDRFAVTEPNDLGFLGYFCDLVLAANAAEPKLVRKAKTLLARFARSTAQPV